MSPEARGTRRPAPTPTSGPAILRCRIEDLTASKRRPGMASRRAVEQVLGCGLSALACGTWLLVAGAGAPAAGAAEPQAAAAAAAGLTPVDPALLSGGTLTLRDANFAVKAPGPEWEWREKPAADLKGTRM